MKIGFEDKKFVLEATEMEWISFIMAIMVTGTFIFIGLVVAM